MRGKKKQTKSIKYINEALKPEKQKDVLVSLKATHLWNIRKCISAPVKEFTFTLSTSTLIKDFIIQRLYATPLPSHFSLIYDGSNTQWPGHSQECHAFLLLWLKACTLKQTTHVCDQKLLTPNRSQASEMTYHLTSVAEQLMNSGNGIWELHGSNPQYYIRQKEQAQP